MAPIRRTLPIAILILTALVICTPILLAMRSQNGANLPEVGYLPVLVVAAKSFSLAVACAVVATGIGLAVLTVAYTLLTSRGRKLLFGLCSIPFLTPPVITAAALFPFTGTWTIAVSGVLSILPFAVIFQALSLRFVNPDELAAARDLGFAHSLTLRRVVLPTWKKGAFLSALWGAFLVVSDPAVFEAFGGTQSFLPSHALRAVLAGAPASQLLIVVATYLVPALVVAVGVSLVVKPSKRIHRPPADAALVIEMLKGMPIGRRYQWFAMLCLGATVVPVLVILGRIGAGLARWLTSTSSSDGFALAPTLVHLLVVLTLSTVGALVLSTAVHRAGGLASRGGWGLVAFMLFASPTAVGVIFALGLRSPVHVGEWMILPTLVGGGGLLGGQLGMVLASISVCLPVSTLLILLVRSYQPSELEVAARDLGAPTPRIISQMDGPMILPGVLVALCFQACIILTYAAPLVFVQPVGTTLSASYTMALVTSGQEDAAFGFAAVSGLLAAVAGLIIYVILRSTLTTWSLPGWVHGRNSAR